jgi:hypothetical protein
MGAVAKEAVGVKQSAQKTLATLPLAFMAGVIPLVIQEEFTSGEGATARSLNRAFYSGLAVRVLIGLVVAGFIAFITPRQFQHYIEAIAFMGVVVTSVMRSLIEWRDL